jgi:hypothetical protein
MPNAFKNAGGALPIAYPVTPIYSAPVATQSIVHSCIIQIVLMLISKFKRMVLTIIT